MSSEREQSRAELIDELMHQCEQAFMAQLMLCSVSWQLTVYTVMHKLIE